MKYRKRELTVTVNGLKFNEIWIDPHYEENHSDSMSDELILRLVRLLDGVYDLNYREAESGFLYWATSLELDGKSYRLVWLMPPDHRYLGVRNAFRHTSQNGKELT